jgi:hypothetical protein
LRERLEKSGVVLINLSRIGFMSLILNAAAAIKDSGGIREETTHLRIPCLTLRENTEQPVTITRGTNRLATVAGLRAAIHEAIAGGRRPGRPDLWGRLHRSAVLGGTAPENRRAQLSAGQAFDKRRAWLVFLALAVSVRCG